MKLNSKHFDSLRAKKAAGTSAAKLTTHPCDWKGCDKAGAHRAPMGRDNEGKYYLFCTDHVREYNASYNYFTGMSDGDVAKFQKDALTGHRPTWKSGANAWSHGTKNGAQTSDPSAAGLNGPKLNDPHGFFAWRAKRTTDASDEPQRYVKPLERKSLDALHLTEKATKEEIKAKFKDLVKQHHPDANGGDKRSEEKLREIIQAYNYLKQSGLV